MVEASGRDWAKDVAAANSSEARAQVLAAAARTARGHILTMIGRARLGHVGGDLSVTDILTALVLGTLRLDPGDPSWPARDRLILSKGHCAAALYALLALRGFITTAELGTFMQPHSALNGHPNRRKVPGVEANTGPLGHGLPIAVGCALAAQLQGGTFRTFVVLGDGELQEGSNWEAAMAASHQGLGSLTAIVDRNRLQQGAPTEATNSLEPLVAKWQAFGWRTIELDGHDLGALVNAFGEPPGQQPRCIIAHTVKGKGVSFMEDRVEWHHKVPSPEQLELALAELRA